MARGWQQLGGKGKNRVKKSNSCSEQVNVKVLCDTHSFATAALIVIGTSKCVSLFYFCFFFLLENGKVKFILDCVRRVGVLPGYKKVTFQTILIVYLQI